LRPGSPTRTQRSPTTPGRSPNVLSSAIRELRGLTVDDPFALNPTSDRKVEVRMGHTMAKAKSPPERFATPMAARGPLLSSSDVTLDVDEPEMVEGTAVGGGRLLYRPIRLPRVRQRVMTSTMSQLISVFCRRRSHRPEIVGKSRQTSTRSWRRQSCCWRRLTGSCRRTGSTPAMTTKRKDRVSAA
jgi:hypothetical protein